MGNQDNRNLNLITVVLSSLFGGGLLGGLVYYLGRRYLEGYYSILGIPANMLTLSAADYIYTSIYSGTIFLLIVSVILLYYWIRLLLVTNKVVNVPLIEQISPIRNDFSFWLLLAIFLIGLVFWIYSFILSPPILKNIIQMIFILISGMYAILLSQHRTVILLFRLQFNVLRRILVFGFSIICIIAIVAIYLSSFSYGEAKGTGDWAQTNKSLVNKSFQFPLPVVYLYAKKELLIPDGNWVSNGDGTFKTETPFVLLLTTNDNYFVMKPDTNGIKNPLIMLDKKDIVAMQNFVSQ